MFKRLPAVPWPHTYPLCMLFGVVLALGLTAATAYLQIKMMRPLQRYYLVPFLKSSLLPMRQDLKLVEVHTTAGRGSSRPDGGEWLRDGNRPLDQRDPAPESDAVFAHR